MKIQDRSRYSSITIHKYGMIVSCASLVPANRHIQKNNVLITS